MCMLHPNNVGFFMRERRLTPIHTLATNQLQSGYHSLSLPGFYCPETLGEVKTPLFVRLGIDISAAV